MTDQLMAAAANLITNVQANQAKIMVSVKTRFEATSAKLETGLTELSAKEVAPPPPAPTGIWLLARKRWGWKFRD